MKQILRRLDGHVRRHSFLRPISNLLRSAADSIASSEKRECAAYIAGDERIFFPALVALVSLEKRNPGTFDRFMIFDGSKLTRRMREILVRYRVRFVDSRSLGGVDEVDSQIS